MKKFWMAVALFSIGLSVFGAEDAVPLKEFLARTRNAAPVSSYAALEGEARHLRRGERTVTMPIYFAIILQPERMTGQIIIDGDEGYILGQTRKGGDSETSVVPMKANAGSAETESKLGRMGIRASDLTMSFLFYPALRELEPVSVRTVPCRVVLLEAPDRSETVKVYIARDHYFPIKAEFFRTGEEKEPYRSLEVNSFKKSDGLYYTDQLGLYGPGWRTIINFDGENRVGPFDPTKPSEIIRQLQ